MLHAFPLSLPVKTSTVAWGYSNRESTIVNHESANDLLPTADGGFT
jgi:hypothetical protein